MQSSAEPFIKWQARSMKVGLISLAVALACVIGVTSSAAIQPSVNLVSLSAARLPIESQLPGFDGAIQWINSPPLDVSALRGKVVLIDFWTYSCINCVRTLPYITGWDAKYRDKGLVIIGAVHHRVVEDAGDAVKANKSEGPVVGHSRCEKDEIFPSPSVDWKIFDRNRIQCARDICLRCQHHRRFSNDRHFGLQSGRVHGQRDFQGLTDGQH